MVRINIDLDEKTHKEFKKLSIDKGLSLKDYVVELIEREVGMTQKSSKKPKTSKTQKSSRS